MPCDLLPSSSFVLSFMIVSRLYFVPVTMFTTVTRSERSTCLDALQMLCTQFLSRYGHHFPSHVGSPALVIHKTSDVHPS